MNFFQTMETEKFQEATVVDGNGWDKSEVMRFSRWKKSFSKQFIEFNLSHRKMRMTPFNLQQMICEKIQLELLLQ